jgi:iron complex outermembrane receptor protein
LTIIFISNNLNLTFYAIEKIMKFPLAVLSFISFTVIANNNEISPELTDLSFDELMQVNITSVSKKSEKLSEASAAVYVVTRNEIRRSGATSIPEALRLVPGVDVAQIDPNKWAIGIRGFNGRFSNKLLVMIDGRSVYTPTFSGVYWENQDYPMDDIERIEVIRGPGATLWGANAVNGIINIITRDTNQTQGTVASIASGNELKGLAEFRYGAEISKEASYRVYAKARKVDNGLNTEGEPQNNGGKYLQLGFRADWQRSDEQWFTFFGDTYNNKMSQVHNIPNIPYSAGVFGITEGDVKNQGSKLGLRWSKLTGLNSEFNVNVNYDYYNRRELKFSEKRDTLDLDFQHKMAPIDNHQLLWGGGYRLSNNELTSGRLLSVDDPDEKIKIWNLFVQDELNFPTLDVTVTLGTKIEGNSYSSSEIQPSLRGSWVPSEQFTWWWAISRATRTPSRVEISSNININALPAFALDPRNPFPTSVQIQGQESFKAEQVDAYESGLRWMPTTELAFDVSVFYNNYTNLRSYTVGTPSFELIDTQPYTVLPLLLANNMVGTTKGLELLVTWQPSLNAKFRFSYSLLDDNLKDTQYNSFSDSFISVVEDRTPLNQASLWGSFDLGPEIELDVRLFYVDKRPWNYFQTLEPIDSNLNANFRLAWSPSDTVELSLVGRNLLYSSRQEFVIETWPEPSQIERSVFAKIKLDW